MPLSAIGYNLASHYVSPIEIAVWRNKCLAEIRERFDEIRLPEVWPLNACSTDPGPSRAARREGKWVVVRLDCKQDRTYDWFIVLIASDISSSGEAGAAGDESY
jgi:hypothetical protein